MLAPPAVFSSYVLFLGRVLACATKGAFFEREQETEAAEVLPASAETRAAQLAVFPELLVLDRARDMSRDRHKIGNVLQVSLGCSIDSIG